MLSSTSMSIAFLLSSMLLAATAAAVNSLAGCQTSCGGIDIPYPFGIGNNDCFHEGFQIHCNNTGSDVPQPFLAGTSIKVAILSTDPPIAQVMLPVGRQCYDKSMPSKISDMSNATTAMDPNGVYRISNNRSMLVVLGYRAIAAMVSATDDQVASGCVSFCNRRSFDNMEDGPCTGTGCCHVNIEPELTNISFAFMNRNHQRVINYSPCDYAFLVDKNYTFQKMDLQLMDRNRTTPVWLDWAIRDNVSTMPMSCKDAGKTTKYACKNKHSECVDSTNGPGYNCNCSQGYEGNAYVHDGCKYIIGRTPVNEYQPFPLPAQLSIGVTLGISFLVTGLLLAILMLQRRRMKIYFKKNGGMILRNVDTLEIFTKEEINKITKNQAVVLGKGCFGQVYKGILPDGTTVAVKTAIKINKDRKEEFTKEVGIQSQMIHKNIIKLLGCCLEVDVPMLVYEFAANGSLQDILHAKNNGIPFPLGLRLDIAIDAAEGLTYMHSSTTHRIRHGDVKPANILLDENNMPKISDFGTSKFLTGDKDRTVLVVGSMEYIDPMFCETGQLTQKSDVYNFGVVLLELITRKPIVYDGNHRLIIEFRNAYEQDNNGRAMFDKDIATEEDIFILEDIGRLAVMCLHKEVKRRPDMKEVAERLVMLRRDRKTGKRNYVDLFDEISLDGTPKSFTSESSY